MLADILTKKQTRLEVVEANEVPAILEYKIKELEEKGAPVEQGLADYIAFGIQNIDEEIKKLTNYKKMLDERIKELKEKKIQISEEIANFLEENGIEKLKGAIVSSITIKPENESEQKKWVLDADKEKLVEMGLAHWEITTKYTPKQIKINKRRIKNEQRVEYLPETE